MDAFVAWAGGDATAADALREIGERGDESERALLNALRAAFVTPLEPEDVFALSRGVDRILDYTRDVVVESEVMASPPDAVIAEMAGLLRKAVRDVAGLCLSRLRCRRGDRRRRRGDQYRARAGACVLQRHGGTARVANRGERIARRELYRRCDRIGEVVIDVAERVVYAVVKQS